MELEQTGTADYNKTQSHPEVDSMTTIYLVCGLAFFTLGVAALLESRRKSVLLLGRQLPWLATFGLTQSMVEWTEMMWLAVPDGPGSQILTGVHIITPPLAALLLIRFGLGLICESGPFPRWLLLFPVVLITPAALIGAYALIIILTEPSLATASDIWTRYLLYTPAAVLAAAGFWRQSKELPLVRSCKVRNMMYGAGLAFAAYALFAGLIVPPAPYGLAPWLNYDLVEEITGAPVQIWRALAALALTVFAVRALGIFDFERKQQLDLLASQRKQAEETLRVSELRFGHVFEYTPIGMGIVSAEGRPLKANRALQEILGYGEEELLGMDLTDRIHPDDVENSRQLAAEVRLGKRDSFQVEQRYYRKDGALVLARVTVSSVPGFQGNFSHSITMIEDITQRKKMETALLHERERLQETRLRIQTEARRVAESWVNVLVDIGQRIAHMDSAEVVLLHIVRQAQKLVQADTVSMALFDAGRQRLGLKYQASATQSHLFDVEFNIADEKLKAALLAGHSRRFPEDGGLSEVSWYCPRVVGEIRAAAVVPLQFDSQVVGGMWAARFQPISFTPNQLFGLENLANQAVIVLQHAGMAAQLQIVATLEERSRIAREMHDGLAQVLGYLGIQMQTIEAYSRQGRVEEVLSEIAKTRQNIKTAQADVRENILSLRTTLAGESGLVASLKEYVHEFGIHTETEARFVNALSCAPQLSPLAEVQLVRIVQEALTNVRKHARAQHIEVQLHHEDEGLAITVTDDGVGFETSNDDLHFGLQTMVERADSIGGRLDLRSAPHEGTQVRLWVPLQREYTHDE
jgi:PAS domain S-box-containing protein